MTAKFTSTPPQRVYDLSRTNPRTPSPLQGFTRVLRNAAWGLSVGFQDCEESAADWWRLLQSGSLEEPGELGVTALFNLLGQPLSGADEYRTPWGAYLDHLEDMELLRALGVEL